MSSLYAKIRGIAGNFFAFDGGDGPLIKNSSGVLEARNTGDAAYAIFRGLDPVGANDLVTLGSLTPILSFESVLVDVSVTAAQNWEVLSVSGSEAPPTTAALGATTEGAVAALATTFGTAHNLDVIAGYNNLEPLNLCMVTDSVGNAIYSSARRVWALLQTEDGTDGHTFNDTDKQAQLSFIRVNSAFTGIEAVPVVDIASKTIRYFYSRRQRLDNIEQGHARQQSPAQNDNDIAVASGLVIIVRESPSIVIEGGTTHLQRDMEIPDGVEIMIEDNGELLIL